MFKNIDGKMENFIRELKFIKEKNRNFRNKIIHSLKLITKEIESTPD